MKLRMYTEEMEFMVVFFGGCRQELRIKQVFHIIAIWDVPLTHIDMNHIIIA